MKLKLRLKTSHKGQNGRVLVIGGSEDYVGAPTLVGLSALATLRCGADLVTVASPEKVAWAINCIAPDLITKKIKCKGFTSKNTADVLKLAKNADVVVIGNGITLTSESKKFMKAVVMRCKIPVIVDAGALHAVRIQDCRHAVFLPHAKELEVLLNNSKLTEKTFQRYLATNILVKKGHPRTEILSSTKKAVNLTGHAGMTHGGTGDVLAGIIAALIAQGNDAFTAAMVATYVNGKAAEQLGKTMGFGYLASDLVDVIPFVLKKFWRQK